MGTTGNPSIRRWLEMIREDQEDDPAVSAAIAAEGEEIFGALRQHGRPPLAEVLDTLAEASLFDDVADDPAADLLSLAHVWANRQQLQTALFWGEIALGFIREHLDPGLAIEYACLILLGNLYLATGELDRCEESGREILRITAQAGIENDSPALLLLSQAACQRGRVADAEELARQAVAMHRGQPGEETFLGTALVSLASILFQLDRHEEAGRAGREAIELLARAEPEGDGGTVLPLAYRLVGQSAMAAGRPAEAEQPLRDFLACAERLGVDRGFDVAGGLHALGWSLVQMGRFAEAESLFLRAQAALDGVTGRLAELLALQIGDHLGHLYGMTEKLDRAEEVLERAHAAAVAALGAEDPELAGLLSSRADIDFGRGKLRDAERLYREALDLLESAGRTESLDGARVHNQLGLLYLAMGSQERCQTLLQQAQEIRERLVGTEHPDYARGLIALAVLDLRKGYSREKQLEQALEILRPLGPGCVDYRLALNHLAIARAYKGRHEAAADAFRQLLALEKAALGELHSLTIQVQQNLASQLALLDQMEEAETLLRRSAEQWRTAFGEDYLPRAMCLRELAILLAARGRTHETGILVSEAAAIEDRLAGQVFSFTSESQRLDFLQSLDLTLIVTLSLARRSGRSRDLIREAFSLVLRRKGLVAQVQTLEQRARLSGQFPHLADRFAELARTIDRIAARQLAGPGPEGPRAHWDEITALKAHRDRLQADLASEIPHLARPPHFPAGDLEVLCRALPEGAALIELARVAMLDPEGLSPEGTRPIEPDRYLAFVLPAGKLDDLSLVDLGEALPIDDDVAELRTAAEGRSVQRNLTMDWDDAPYRVDTGTRLRQRVFDPLLPALQGCKRLLISPAGALSLLSFEVLPTSEDSYLIDDYAISYLASGTDVLRFGAGFSGVPGAPMVVAAPDFDLGSAAGQGPSYLTPLDDLLPEGIWVAQQLGAKLWTGPEAVESLFREIRSPRILHIATHGLLLDDPLLPVWCFLDHKEIVEIHSNPGRLHGAHLDDPLVRSALALAGANTWLREEQPPPEAGDGLLTAAEVASLDLQNTELVVLSACHTGGGSVRVGDGVMGLRRSFAVAGARTLVISLWEVPDRETRELMEAFYGYLLAGSHGRAEALRQAQLDLKARGYPPAAWSAFICQGDPGPLSSCQTASPRSL